MPSARSVDEINAATARANALAIHVDSEDKPLPRFRALLTKKLHGLKFQLIDYKDRLGRIKPCYQLTKAEGLYIATVRYGFTLPSAQAEIAAKFCL